MEAGTALAIVSLSIQVLEGVSDYYKLWKDGEQDVREFREAIQRLSRILTHLETTMQKPFLEQSIISTICSACKRVEQDVGEMETLLADVMGHGPPSSLLQKVKHAGRRACYPFRRKTIAHFMEIIEDMINHLGLELQILSLYVKGLSMAQERR